MKDATIDELRGYVDQLLAMAAAAGPATNIPILQISTEGHALLKDAAAAPELSLARQKRPIDRLPKRSRVETEGWEASIAIFRGAARAATGDCARRACRRTSSSTTRRCARSRG